MPPLVSHWRALSRFTKIAAALGACSAALVSTITALSLLGVSPPATRTYVDRKLEPVVFRQLVDRRRLLALDLFQWESNNPEPRSRPVQDTIDRIRSEIANVERRIAELRK